jgi:hypothetical protein
MKKSRFHPVVLASLIVGGVAVAVLLAFVFGWLVMILWNWLMPEIFGLGTITYWQAWGLVLLSHILFKSGSGHGEKTDRHEDGCDEERWKRRFRERFYRKEENPEGENAGEAPHAETDEQGE